MKKVLITGAASAIARETIRLMAHDQAQLYLTDISLGRLEAVRQDVLARHTTKIEISQFDVTQFDRHQAIFNSATGALGGLDCIFLAHGTLPDQAKAQSDTAIALKEFAINCTSVISLCTIAAEYFTGQGHGTIAVISSVAGDRGRGSNYIYGSAKGAVSLYLQGLRNRVDRLGVKVITIKPGLVDTPMTAHLPKNPLFSDPAVIGKGIYEAIEKGKDIAYLPAFWRLVMMAIRAIPESIFKKMNL